MSKFALIIANTDYADPDLAKLTAPGKDAQDFARVLQAEDIGAFDNVTIVENETEAVVRDAIDLFFSMKKHDDLLVMYFSGHGVRDEYGALFLAVKNTNRSRLRASAIKSDFVRESMDQSNSRRQVLILDCCNSGAFAQGTKSATGISVGTGPAFEGVGYGRVVLTATDATQFAWEGDKIIGEQTTNSLFTHFLVQGLQGEADRDGDGRISVDELYDYAFEQIVSRTPKQTPGKWSYKQQGEILLRQPARGEPRPLPLPEELTAAITSSYPSFRETAVRQLEELLKGRNVGLALSARAALERISTEDDSRRVAQAALDVLAPVQQAERAALAAAEREGEEQRLAQAKAEEERKAEEEHLAQAKAEAERAAERKAEEERLVQAKAEAERAAERKAEEERLVQAKAEAERAAERKAEEERLVQAKAEAERAAERKAEEERLVQAKAEAERIATAEREAQEERIAQTKAEEERSASPKAEKKRLAGKQNARATKQSLNKVPVAAAEVRDAEEKRQAMPKTEAEPVAVVVAPRVDEESKTRANIEQPVIERTATIPPEIMPDVLEKGSLAFEKEKDMARLDWASVGWMAIGEAIVFSLIMPLVGAINQRFSGNSVYIIAAIPIGALSGLVIAIVLRNAQVLSGWKSMLWISLGWTIGLVLPVLVLNGFGDGTLALIVFSVIFGGMAGLAAALTLRQEKVLSGWKSMLWITLGWMMGVILAVAVSRLTTSVLGGIGIYDGSDTGHLIAFGSMGATFGFFGGGVLVFQLSRERQWASMPQAPESEKGKVRPGWSAVFWITLGLSYSFLIFYPLQVGFYDPSIGWYYSYSMAFALSGALTGFVITIVLRLEHVLTGWKSLLLLSLLWAIIFAPFQYIWRQDSPTIRYLMMVIWSGVGGLAIALTLWQKHLLPDWKSLLWVSLGWMMSIAVCLMWMRVVGFDNTNNEMIGVCAGGLLGAIGGTVMVFQLRKTSS